MGEVVEREMEKGRSLSLDFADLSLKVSLLNVPLIHNPHFFRIDTLFMAVPSVVGCCSCRS